MSKLAALRAPDPTLASFIPDRQEEKLPIIQEAAKTFADAFDPANVLPPPTDAAAVEIVAIIAPV